MRRTKLKLFIWTGFCPDHTDGLAVAIAKDETDARSQIIKVHGYNPNHWGTLTVYRLNRRMAVTVSGGG